MQNLICHVNLIGVFFFSVAFEEREHILIPEQLSFIMLFLIFDLSQKTVNIFLISLWNNCSCILFYHAYIKIRNSIVKVCLV